MKFAASDAGYSLLEGTFTGGVNPRFARTGPLAGQPEGSGIVLGAPWMTHPGGFTGTPNRSIPLPADQDGAGEPPDLATAGQDLQIETGASSWLRLPRGGPHPGGDQIRRGRDGGASRDGGGEDRSEERPVQRGGRPDPLCAAGSVYQSVDFDTAVHRVDILAETGVGSLEIR